MEDSRRHNEPTLGVVRNGALWSWKLSPNVAAAISSASHLAPGVCSSRRTALSLLAHSQCAVCLCCRAAVARLCLIKLSSGDVYTNRHAYSSADRGRGVRTHSSAVCYQRRRCCGCGRQRPWLADAGWRRPRRRPVASSHRANGPYNTSEQPRTAGWPDRPDPERRAVVSAAARVSRGKLRRRRLMRDRCVAERYCWVRQTHGADATAGRVGGYCCCAGRCMLQPALWTLIRARPQPRPARPSKHWPAWPDWFAQSVPYWAAPRVDGELRAGGVCIRIGAGRRARRWTTFGARDGHHDGVRLIARGGRYVIHLHCAYV